MFTLAQQKESCNTCSGSGQCQGGCNGTGKKIRMGLFEWLELNCSSCSGSGKCSSCGGEGKK